MSAEVVYRAVDRYSTHVERTTRKILHRLYLDETRRSMYNELRGSYDLNLACARAHGIGKAPIGISIKASEHRSLCKLRAALIVAYATPCSLLLCYEYTVLTKALYCIADPLSKGFDPSSAKDASAELLTWLHLFYAYLQIEQQYADALESMGRTGVP